MIFLGWKVGSTQAMAEQQAEKGSIQVIERMMSLLDVLADMPDR
jgi:hypothetical protein